MKRIDKYDLSKASELNQIFDDYMHGPYETFAKFSEELYKEITTKKRYELIKCDEDLEAIAKEHQDFCSKFDGVCRDGCPYGSHKFNNCFVNFLMEEVEVE